jgi:hypothetical protein
LQNFDPTTNLCVADVEIFYSTAITIWWPTTKSFNEMVLNVNRSCWSAGTNAKRVSVVKIRVVSTNVKNMFQTCDEKFSV